MLTYTQLHRRVAEVASGLRAAGVTPGSYVAVAMERSQDLVLTLLGVMAAGACACPMEPRVSVEETARRVAHHPGQAPGARPHAPAAPARREPGR